MHGDLEAYLLPASFRFGGKPVGLGVLYEPTCIFPCNEARDFSPQLETAFERMLYIFKRVYICATRTELDLVYTVQYTRF